ncbi:MAG TPA: hypothetical protein VHZ24_00985 [Pirellulales bacterium]|jgi:hypothetical protein|nr:hypothetical protein [Pirellulales bacterium]
MRKTARRSTPVGKTKQQQRNGQGRVNGAPRRTEPTAPAKPAIQVPWANRLVGTFRRPGELVVGMLLAAAALATYSNSFFCGLVLDNFLIIGADTRLKEFSRANIQLIFSRGYWWPTWESDLFRPLTTFSYMVNYSVLGNESAPPGYHIVNLFLHWANTFMFYGLVLALLKKHWTALLAALIFVVHPLTTESVTNIVGRADLLVSFAVLGCLHLHRLSYDRRVPRLLCYVPMGVLTLLGVFCKESAVVVVFALLFYDVAFNSMIQACWRLFRSARGFPFNVVVYVVVFVAMPVLTVKFFKLPMEYLIVLPLFLVVPAGVFLFRYDWDEDPRDIRDVGERFLRYGWMSYVAIAPGVLAMLAARQWMLWSSPVFDQIGADNPIACAEAFTPHISNNALVQGLAAWVTKRMSAVKVIGYYAALFVWPRVLSCDYSYDQIPLFRWSLTDVNDVHCWLGLLGCILATLVMIRAYWTNKPLFFFLTFFWFGSGFFLTANLLIDIGSIMGERFMYLPLVGMVGCLAAVAPRATKVIAHLSRIPVQPVRNAVGVLGLLAVVGLGVRSFARNYDWMDEMSLWTSAVEACPDSFKVYKGLAGAIAGQDPSGQNLMVLNDSIHTVEQGRSILDTPHGPTKSKLPPTDMPNGVYQDVARYYLSRGDAQTRRVDPTMQTLPLNAKLSYERSAEALEQARGMDREVNRASRESRLGRGVPINDVLDVGNFRIYQNLGVAYLRLQHFDDAVQAFNDMQRLEPTQPDVYYNRAIALLGRFQVTHSRESLEQAIMDLLRALILRSEWPDAWGKLQAAFGALVPGENIVIHLPDPPPNGRWNLNADQATARVLLNTALVGLMQTMIDTKRWQQADEVYNLAVNAYKCPIEQFAAQVRQVQAAKEARRNQGFTAVGLAAVLGIALGATLILGISWIVIKLGAADPDT